MQLGPRVRLQKSFVPLFEAVNSKLTAVANEILWRSLSLFLERYVYVNFCAFLPFFWLFLTEFRRRLASGISFSVTFVFGSKGYLVALFLVLLTFNLSVQG